MPLEAYDDREFETRKPLDWLKMNSMASIAKYASSGGQFQGVGGQGLWKDKDGLCYWRKVRIMKFLPKTERFEGYWENTKEKCRLHRIFVLFDEEDPRQFVRRFK